MSEHRFVYFIKHVPSGCIKIGYTRNPRERLNVLRTAHPNPDDLQPLFFVRGGPGMELKLHKALLNFHHVGEWYKIPEDILSALETNLAIDSTTPSDPAIMPATTTPIHERSHVLDAITRAASRVSAAYKTHE